MNVECSEVRFHVWQARTLDSVLQVFVTFTLEFEVEPLVFRQCCFSLWILCFKFGFLDIRL